MFLKTRTLIFFCLSLLSAGSHAEGLLELYHHALANNPGLKQFEYEIDRKEAQQDQALSRLRPQVSITGNRSRNDFFEKSSGSDQYNSSRAGIQGRQALFDLPSYRRLEGAKARTSQSKEQLAASRIDLAEELVDRYLDVLTASDEIAYLQAETQAVDSQLARLRRMHERQLAKVTDLYEVEAYRQTLNARDIEKQNAKEVALEKLRETTGMTVKEVAPLASQDLLPAPGNVDQWLDEGTHNNRNLSALQYAIESEERTIASARAEHLPQLALVASRTYSDSDSDNRRNTPFNVTTIGLQVTMSFYEGGRVQAGVQEAVARRHIAQAQYEQKRREIEREIRTAYLGTIANRARIEATAQAVRAQEKSRDAQQRSYELAVSTIVDLLDSQKRLFQLRSEQSKARYDFIRSLVILRIRAGALSDRDIEEINGWNDGSALR